MLEVIFYFVAPLVALGLTLGAIADTAIADYRGRQQLRRSPPALPPVPNGSPPRGPVQRHPLAGLRYVAPEAWPDWARERGRRG